MAQPGGTKSEEENIFSTSWLFLRWRGGRGLLRWPMRKKQFDQFFFDAVEILAHDLQRRLIGFWSHQQRFVDFANSFAHLKLQPAVAVGMFFCVGMLLLQGLQRGADIVAIFFQR